MSLEIKICGITRPEDGRAAADAGADLIGLNFWPRSPRHVTVERAREIADAVSGRLEIVALFVDAPREEIIRVTGEIGARTVQLHGREDAAFVRSLEGFRVIKAFHVQTEGDLERLRDFPADLYLLDARTDEMPGGTGRTNDWELARRAGDYGRILLAGGLTPENVGEAVRTVKPWGVDCATGTESAPGIKDKDRMRRFVENARLAG